MTTSDLVSELLYPVRNMTVLLAVITFGLAFTVTILIMQVNAILAVAGSALALGLLIALFRYGMSLLEARANQREPSVADIGMFSVFDNLWRIFPIVLLFPVTWIGVYIGGTVGTVGVIAWVAAFLTIFPASLAVLAITWAPLQSVNPAAIGRMIRAIGPGYAAIPLMLIALLAVSHGLGAVGIPMLADVLLDMYVLFLLFTLTGAMAGKAGVAQDIDIGAPLQKTDSELRSATMAEREKVANHAYGLISRGNREGGFKHIRDWVQGEADPHDAIGWFFHTMTQWESPDAALFFGQECISHYISHDMDAEALKLMSTCMHQDPRWRPRADDLPHAIALAERHGREDLLKSLRG